MKISAEKVGTSVVANIEGELDMANADQLRDAIDEKLRAYETVRDVFLVFESVPFMDSSGLAVLLGRYEKLQKRGGHLAVVNPNPQVRRVLELSGLTKLVRVYDDLSQARQNVGGITNG